MNLEIQSIWSPDLNPPSNGLPENVLDFDVFIQMRIGEVDKSGSEVFGCRVCSTSTLSKSEYGQFISHTLVVKQFDWSEIEKRIEKLLLHVSSCATWDCVIKKLSPCIEYADEW